MARSQHHVVSRAQALAHGFTDDAIAWRLTRRQWRRLHTGVYLTHSGAASWWSEAWAATLYAGRGSAIAMLGAAHVHRLVDRPPPGLVILVPRTRRVRAHPPRLQVQHRRLVAPTRVNGIPVTTVEDTVLDLGGIRGAEADEVIAHAARAVQRKLTTPDRIVAALSARGRYPHREALSLALGDVRAGAESVLEVGFLRGVARRHGLSTFRMQVPDQGHGRDIRRDFLEDETKVIVEVDGVLGHVGEGMWRDRRRDRTAARDGWLSLRCGWVDVRHRPCDLALDIALTMRSRGWTGRPKPCGPACAVLSTSP